jgi:hypothetical protein
LSNIRQQISGSLLQLFFEREKHRDRSEDKLMAQRVPPVAKSAAIAARIWLRLLRVLSRGGRILAGGKNCDGDSDESEDRLKGLEAEPDYLSDFGGDQADTGECGEFPGARQATSLPFRGEQKATSDQRREKDPGCAPTSEWAASEV